MSPLRASILPRVAVAALLCSFLWVPPVQAENVQVAYGSYLAGLPTHTLQGVVARQHNSQWCWAACIQMVLNYHDVPVSQEQVVQRIYGRQVNAPAPLGHILSALRGWAVEGDGQRVYVSATSYSVTSARVVRDLAYRRPLIAGLVDDYGNGHAVVLTAVQYHVDQSGNAVLDYAVIRDPWPANPSRQVIPWSRFGPRLYFLVRVGVNEQ